MQTPRSFHLGAEVAVPASVPGQFPHGATEFPAKCSEACAAALRTLEPSKCEHVCVCQLEPLTAFFLLDPACAFGLIPCQGSPDPGVTSPCDDATICRPKAVRVSDASRRTGVMRYLQRSTETASPERCHM